MHRPERRGDVEGAIGEDDGLVGRRFGDAAETLRRVSAMRETVDASARFEVRARAEVPTDRVQCRIVAADAARLVGAAARAIDTGPQAYTCRCELRHRLGVGAPTREFSAHDRIRAPLPGDEIGLGEQGRRPRDHPLAAERLSGGDAADADERHNRQTDDDASAGARADCVINSASA